jgi:hypothetical protein
MSIIKEAKSSSLSCKLYFTPIILFQASSQTLDKAPRVYPHKLPVFFTTFPRQTFTEKQNPYQSLLKSHFKLPFICSSVHLFLRYTFFLHAIQKKSAKKNLFFTVFDTLQYRLDIGFFSRSFIHTCAQLALHFMGC